MSQLVGIVGASCIDENLMLLMTLTVARWKLQRLLSAKSTLRLLSSAERFI